MSRREVVDLLARHGLRPSRALGQNFVADPNTVRRIARLAEVGTDDRVVEIGAGLGSLTLALAETGATVVAIELDRYLLPVLREVLAGHGADRVRVVEGDALRLDWSQVLREPADSGGSEVREPHLAASRIGGGWVLVANLPYNVATPLVAQVLDEVPQIGRLLVMVQREVGERLVAAPGSRAYGAVSVKVAYWAEGRLAGRVPASVFVPRPRVESVLVALERRPAPAVDPGAVDRDWLFTLVRAGFAHRRKMLRGALAGLADAEAFARAGIEPTARAEELDVAAWGRLAACTASGPPPN